MSECDCTYRCAPSAFLLIATPFEFTFIIQVLQLRSQIGSCMQVHGFPKVMGVLTHLDGFKDPTKLKAAKKTLKHRFWAEIYQGDIH